MQILRVLFFGLGLFFWKTNYSQQRPILWKESVLELGTLTEGDSVRGSFQFSNPSSQSVLLKNLQTTCGCTSTNFPSGKKMAPHSTDSFTFVYRSAGQVGHLHKLLVFTYESGAELFSDTLILHGEVLPPPPKYRALFPYKNEHLLLLTPLVVFGNITGKERVKAKITLGLEGRKKEKMEVQFLPKGVHLKSTRIYADEVNVIWLEAKVKKLKDQGLVELPFLIRGKKTGETFDMKLSYYWEGKK